MVCRGSTRQRGSWPTDLVGKRGQLRLEMLKLFEDSQTRGVKTCGDGNRLRRAGSTNTSTCRAGSVIVTTRPPGAAHL